MIPPGIAAFCKQADEGSLLLQQYYQIPSLAAHENIVAFFAQRKALAREPYAIVTGRNQEFIFNEGVGENPVNDRPYGLGLAFRYLCKDILSAQDQDVFNFPERLNLLLHIIYLDMLKEVFQDNGVQCIWMDYERPRQVQPLDRFGAIALTVAEGRKNRLLLLTKPDNTKQEGLAINPDLAIPVLLIDLPQLIGWSFSIEPEFDATAWVLYVKHIVFPAIMHGVYKPFCGMSEEQKDRAVRYIRNTIHLQLQQLYDLLTNETFLDYCDILPEDVDIIRKQIVLCLAMTGQKD